MDRLIDQSEPRLGDDSCLFSPHATSAAETRLFVKGLFPGLSTGDLELAASELASNAIRHARTDFIVRVRTREDFVRIEVTDARPLDNGSVNPRSEISGLQIVEALSQRRGVEPSHAGKTVWAELRHPESV